MLYNSSVKLEVANSEPYFVIAFHTLRYAFPKGIGFAKKLRKRQQDLR